MLNFRGGDIAEVFNGAGKNGLNFEQPLTKEADGSMSAEIRDPDGNAIYFNTSPSEREKYLATGKVANKGDP